MPAAPLLLLTRKYALFRLLRSKTSSWIVTLIPLFSPKLVLRTLVYFWFSKSILDKRPTCISVFCDCRTNFTSNIIYELLSFSLSPNLGYYDLCWLLLCSTFHHWNACFCGIIGIPLVGNLQTRPPRVRTITFPPCHCRLYQGLFRVVLDFSLYSNLILSPWPYSRFLFISAVVCSSSFLQIPPHDGHPCPWLVVPTTTAHSGLSPPSYRPCRAHCKQP